MARSLPDELKIALRSLRIEQPIAFRRLAEFVLIQQNRLDRKLPTFPLIFANLRNRHLHERQRIPAAGPKKDNLWRQMEVMFLGNSAQQRAISLLAFSLATEKDATTRR
jgi:hypothetical protein